MWLGKWSAAYAAMDAGELWTGILYKSETDQNLLDGFELLTEGDNLHGAATLGAQRGIGHIHVFDQPSPPALENPSGRRRWGSDTRVWRSARPLML